MTRDEDWKESFDDSGGRVEIVGERGVVGHVRSYANKSRALPRPLRGETRHSLSRWLGCNENASGASKVELNRERKGEELSVLPVGRVHLSMGCIVYRGLHVQVLLMGPPTSF